MSDYGLDLEKVELRFAEVLATQDDKQIAEFAKHIIPSLIADTRKTRLEVVELLLK
ncbi:hypothetical protein [Paenibacillus sp. GXUN7292]|uniref:hypothetical protein n=1 Tax=Paenibacillus sp. GXUN7292 TaxID=3422499 RepID=UPI003D7D0E17